jgi:hypothetical protein
VTSIEVRVYQALAVKQGLKSLQQGFRLNRAYTSTNLRRTAGHITGRTYKAGKNGIVQAISDLERWLNEHRTIRELEVSAAPMPETKMPEHP